MPSENPQDASRDAPTRSTTPGSTAQLASPLLNSTKQVSGNSSTLMPQDAATGGVARNVAFAFLMVVMVLFTVLNSYLQVKVTKGWENITDEDGTTLNSEMFIAQFQNIVYILVIGVLVYPRMMSNCCRGANPVSSFWRKMMPPIEKDTRCLFPQSTFALMASFDTLANVCMFLSASIVSPNLQPVLDQALIPFTLLISVVALARRYAYMQYVGAFFILVGSAMAIWACQKQAKQAGEQNEDQYYTFHHVLRTYFYNSSEVDDNPILGLIFVAVYLGKSFFYGVSYCYKDGKFQDAKQRSSKGMDLWYLSSCVNIYQGILTPVVFLILNAAIHGRSVGKQGKDFKTCFVDCFLGLGNNSDIAQQCADGNLATILILFSLANVTFTTLQLVIVKYASASMATVMSVGVALPISYLIFFLVPDPEVQVHWNGLRSWFGIFGMLIVVVAFGTYYRYEQTENEEDQEFLCEQDLVELGGDDEGQEDNTAGRSSDARRITLPHRESEINNAVSVQ